MFTDRMPVPCGICFWYRLLFFLKLEIYKLEKKSFLITCTNLTFEMTETIDKLSDRKERLVFPFRVPVIFCNNSALSEETVQSDKPTPHF
jgi:hypothetical protein